MKLFQMVAKPQNFFLVLTFAGETQAYLLTETDPHMSLHWTYDLPEDLRVVAIAETSESIQNRALGLIELWSDIDQLPLTKKEITIALFGNDNGIDYALPQGMLADIQKAVPYKIDTSEIAGHLVYSYKGNDSLFGRPVALTLKGREMLRMYETWRDAEIAKQ